MVGSFLSRRPHGSKSHILELPGGPAGPVHPRGIGLRKAVSLSSAKFCPSPAQLSDGARLAQGSFELRATCPSLIRWCPPQHAYAAVWPIGRRQYGISESAVPLMFSSLSAAPRIRQGHNTEPVRSGGNLFDRVVRCCGTPYSPGVMRAAVPVQARLGWDEASRRGSCCKLTCLDL